MLWRFFLNSHKDRHKNVKTEFFLWDIEELTFLIKLYLKFDKEVKISLKWHRYVHKKLKYIMISWNNHNIIIDKRTYHEINYYYYTIIFRPNISCLYCKLIYIIGQTIAIGPTVKFCINPNVNFLIRDCKAFTQNRTCS